MDTPLALLSTCCGAPPLGEIHDGLGLCRRCRDHATFTSEEDVGDPDFFQQIEAEIAALGIGPTG
jgi:hypothetical protein